MPNYVFKTPVVEEGPAGNHRLFYFYKLDRGISIAKTGSSYSQIRYPLDESMDDYDAFYIGGHNHIVTEAEKTALIAGGVGVTEANFTAV
jgi:hypothetical protein